jgi:NIPSNAP
MRRGTLHMNVRLVQLHYGPGNQARVDDAYAKAQDAGDLPAPLRGYWNVDVGPLNTAVLLFELPDGSDLDVGDFSAALDSAASLPTDIVVSSESLDLQSAPFSGALGAAAYGAIYELRIYSCKTNSVAPLLERWAELIDERRELSPLVGCFTCASDSHDTLVHIWAYEDAAARQRIRADAVRLGVWPPRILEFLTTMENMLIVPSMFSPLH